jgi:hypothetical protein
MISAARFRLRADLRLEKAGGTWQIRDPALRRLLRLGPDDAALVRRLVGGLRGTDLGSGHGREAASRLSALARLYLLEGERSRRRLELEREARPERERMLAGTEGEPLEWLPGPDPPRHSCQANGACCSGSFLGPLSPADVGRVASLSPGQRRQPGLGDEILEHLVHDGQSWVGMRRLFGRCGCQGGDRLCDLHAVHGLASKPVVCRQFPLRFHRSPAGIQVSLTLACADYAAARAAAGPWVDREAEVRQLLAEGAPVVRLALPFCWAAGVPVRAAEQAELRSLLLVLAAGEEPRLALAAILAAFEDRLAREEARLREGEEIRWEPATRGLGQVLRSEASLLTPAAEAGHRADLEARSRMLAGQGEANEAGRLGVLAAALPALGAGRGLRPFGPFAAPASARRLLADLLPNDLLAQVSVGELDAGLASLACRLLVAEAVACTLAARAGRTEVGAAEMTRGLAVACRSEADISALARSGGRVAE